MVYFFFFLDLLLTICVEGLAILSLSSRPRSLLYGTFCNLLTNPALHLGLLAAVHLGGQKAYLPAFLVGELLVFLLEAFLLRHLCAFSLGKAHLASLLMNISSLFLGMMLYGGGIFLTLFTFSLEISIFTSVFLYRNGKI